MASRAFHLGVAAIVAMISLWVGASAQSACMSTIVGLAPCLNFIQGGSSAPTSSCCTQLAKVVSSNPQCLCVVLNNGGIPSLGITVNRTRALELPGACQVQTPPPSRCSEFNGDGSPIAAPSPTAIVSGKARNGPAPAPSPSNASSSPIPILLIVSFLFVAACLSKSPDSF